MSYKYDIYIWLFHTPSDPKRKSNRLWAQVNSEIKVSEKSIMG